MTYAYDHSLALKERWDFSPFDISNKAFWYDVFQSQITLNGSDVSAVTDAFGLQPDLAQVVAADQPAWDGVNNQITFDGVTEYLQTAAFASALSQPNTIICVGETNSIDTTYFYDGIVSTNRHALLTILNPGLVYWIWSGTGALKGGNVDTNKHILMAVYNTTASKLYVDGGAATLNGNIGSHTLTGLTAGARYSAAEFWTGSIQSILGFNKLVSNSELNQLGNFFAGYGPTWTTIP